MSISVRLGLSPVKVCRVLILCLPFFPASLAQEQCKAFTHSLSDIVFTRFKTTQNLRSRSFLLRTARMFECTLFILCCSCPGLSVACNSSLGSVLPPALVPAEKKQWKKVSAGKCDQDGGLKKCKDLHAHGRINWWGQVRVWECLFQQGYLIGDSVSWEFWGKKGETTKKCSHRPDKTTMETMTRNKPHQSHWWMGCPEAKDTTFSKISMRQEWSVSHKTATGEN